MATNEIDNKSIKSVANELARANIDKYEWSFKLPLMKKRVRKLIAALRGAMYPGIFGKKCCPPDNIEAVIEKHLGCAALLLTEMLGDIMPGTGGREVDSIVKEYIKSLSKIEEILQTDITAAYEGDPAALSGRDIMLAYPSFEAISVYRLAHGLYALGVPLIPRMMTEYAHRITGIDIHPGASIGKFFFIDHGTGVVIGETCNIGDRVKLYQGVTLGAKSFELDERGHPVKGVKRHPDIGNNVVIYANATILGGNTKIGDGCIIGASVWLTRSVEPGKKVFYNNAN